MLDIIGEVACLNAIDLICRTSLNSIEAVKHVALHHDELSNAIDHDRIAQGHKVYPAATALTTSDSTILMAEVTDLLASLVEQLCGERTCSDTGAVGFHNTIHLSYFIRTDTQTCAGSCTNRVAGGYKRIAAEIDIKHRPLSAFAQHALSC